jgi:hypothetical protein
VPHVRLSVRGPKTTGEALECFHVIDHESRAGLQKAIEIYHFRPTYPDFLYGAPPTPACAAFFKESRMKCANASKLDRKSGDAEANVGHPSSSNRVLLGHRSPVQFLLGSGGV